MENFCSNILSNYKQWLMIFGIGIMFSSCNVIFEKDISEENVNIIIPSEGDTISSNLIHFKWEALKGATHYNLQLVQPSFANIDAFILDSNITEEEFQYVLSPGDYEFQLRAENSAYQSQYTGPFHFYVDSVTDLSAQLVPLVSPSNNLYTNGDNFTYSWLPNYAAEYYEFQLRSGNDFESSGTVLFGANNIYSTSYTGPLGLLSTEGAYSWGVRAHNSTSSSNYSSHTLLIDRTSPNDPIAISPAHGTNFEDTVVMKWSGGVDPGVIKAPVWAQVEIATDTLFGTIIHAYNVEEDSVQHVFSSPGTYWWRVFLYDNAGNLSTFYTEHRKVLID